MPTDESYLDSLLSGISSESKTPNNRFSSYPKKQTTQKEKSEAEQENENEEETAVKAEVDKDERQSRFEDLFEIERAEEKNDSDETPDFLDEYFVDTTPPPVTHEESAVRLEEIHSEPAFDFVSKPDTNFEDPVVGTGEFNNYNIFDDYDDAVIDKMIDDELSGGKTSGEPFVVSENGSFDFDSKDETFDFLSGVEDDWIGKDVEHSLADQIAEMENETEKSDNENGMDDIFGSEADEALPLFEMSNEEELTGGPADEAEENAFDNLFGDLNNSSDSGEFDGGDSINLENNGEDSSLFGEFNLEKENEAEDENPLSGFVFDAEEPEQVEGASLFGEDGFEGIDGVKTNGPLEEMGMDSLNDDDIAALDNLFSEMNLSDDEDDEEVAEKKPKKSVVKEKKPWYIKIFGNVKIPEDKIKPELSEEEIEKRKAEAKEAAKALKETKKAEKDAKKKAAAEEKAAKARRTAEEKEEARKKKLEEANRLILEDVGNTTKLNKFGVAVVFALFLGIAVLIISGGKTLEYNTRIRQASKYFDNALEYKDVTYYTKAYEKVYSLEIEQDDRDYLLWDKIMTINFVNIQITSYNSHMRVGAKTDALEDLFKGMHMVRKYFTKATDLGAQDDMEFVRSVILRELENQYGISESEVTAVLDNYDLNVKAGEEEKAKYEFTKYLYEKQEQLAYVDKGWYEQ